MVVFGTFFLFLIMFFNHLKILLLKNEEKLINWAQFYNKMIYILDINCILYILSTPWETLFSLDHGLRGRLNFKSVISYKVQFVERRPFFSFYPLSLFDFPQRISGGGHIIQNSQIISREEQEMIFGTPLNFHKISFLIHSSTLSVKTDCNTNSQCQNS